MSISAVPLSLARLAFLAILPALVWAIYYPGLSGDFEFDDGVNILDNTKLLLETLDWDSIRRVLASGDAGPLGRPISMLSFALNYYFSGFDPYYFKLVNVLIHMLNACLVFVVAKALLRYVMPDDTNEWRLDGYSLLLALLWAVSPINLTSVLYVVQRMTSLSALFSLCAVYCYVNWRIACLSGNVRGFAWTRLFACLAALLASILAKEVGVMTFAYLAAIEITVFKFRDEQRGAEFSHKGLQLAFAVPAVLALVAVIWQLLNQDWRGFAAGYSIRDFTLEQRLLTQARVIFVYVRQVVLPDISWMGLYHDDYELSKGLFQPISTLISICSLLGLVLIALWSVTRVPWLAFGLLWFLLGHSLESTIFPLELIHEHRNYLPSIGLFVALLGKFHYLAARLPKLHSIVTVACILMILIYAIQTRIRADQWANLFDHAAIEVANHPNSERANYQLGRMYFKLYFSDKKDDYYSKASHYFSAASSVNSGQNGGLFGLIHLAYLADKPVNRVWLDELKQRLRLKPMYPSNVPMMNNLFNCQTYHYCKLPADDLAGLADAVKRNSTAQRDVRASMDSLLGVYYASKIGDGRLAERYLLSAFELNPLPEHALNISGLYIWVKEYAKARQYLDLAIGLDRHGYFRDEILRQKSQIDSAR